MSRKPTTVTKAKILSELVSEVRRMTGLSVLISQAVADRVGLAPSDLEYFDVIVLAEAEVTPGWLMRETGLTSGAITGVVDRLERAGFVRREHDPNDRRKVIVRPEPKRLAELMKYYAPLQNAMTYLWTSYTSSELQLILEFTRRGCDTSMRELDRIRAMPKLATSGTPDQMSTNQTERKRAKR